MFILYIADVTFAHFLNGVEGDIDAAIVASSKSDGCNHPMTVEGLTLIDVVNPVFFQEPNEG